MVATWKHGIWWRLDGLNGLCFWNARVSIDLKCFFFVCCCLSVLYFCLLANFNCWWSTTPFVVCVPMVHFIFGTLAYGGKKTITAYLQREIFYWIKLKYSFTQKGINLYALTWVTFSPNQHHNSAQFIRNVSHPKLLHNIFLHARHMNRLHIRTRAPSEFSI